jgi:rRNA-processing protein FCF1
MEAGTPLFTVKNFSNVLRALNEEDQKRYAFAMTRVLSLGRLKKARCESLFKSLRDAMEVKRNQLKRQRNEAKRDFENARDDLLQAQAVVTLQYVLSTNCRSLRPFHT